MNEQYEILNDKYEKLQKRYENRESREEDVLEIRKLKGLCREKDELIKKTLDDMKFYKLELVNREKNYNKLFGNSPNVGLMDVLPEPATIGRKSTKRTSKNQQ